MGACKRVEPFDCARSVVLDEDVEAREQVEPNQAAFGLAPVDGDVALVRVPVPKIVARPGCLFDRITNFWRLNRHDIGAHPGRERDPLSPSYLCWTSAVVSEATRALNFLPTRCGLARKGLGSRPTRGMGRR